MLFYHHTNVNLPYDRTSHISWWNRFRHPVSCVCFMLQVLRKPKKNLLMCTTDCLHRLSEGKKKKKKETGKESWQLTLPRDLAMSRITIGSFPVNRLCSHLKNKNTKNNTKPFLESCCTVIFPPLQSVQRNTCTDSCPQTRSRRYREVLPGRKWKARLAKRCGKIWWFIQAQHKQCCLELWSQFCAITAS